MFFFKTPKFWYGRPSIFHKLFLRPISWIYDRIAHYHYLKPYAHQLNGNPFIIAIGGITSGGSGKTVIVSSLCDIIKKNGHNPAVLSRGYGRNNDKIMQVNPLTDSYKDVGDEPLLLSHKVPVFVGRNRFETAKLAKNFDYLLLDDGITQRFLKPDKKILVISASQGFGNGELLPLGPNRLAFDKIKSDIDAIILIYEKKETEKFSFSFSNNIPIYRGYINHNFKDLKGRLMLFCGLGYPAKFFQSFSNFEVCKTITFPDHYPYKETDIKNLIQESTRLHAQLVTTEKDLMRIPEKYRYMIKTSSISIDWKDSIKEVLIPSK